MRLPLRWKGGWRRKSRRWTWCIRDRTNACFVREGGELVHGGKHFLRGAFEESTAARDEERIAGEHAAVAGLDASVTW